jgi:hypothetical protein
MRGYQGQLVGAFDQSILSIELGGLYILVLYLATKEKGYL